MEQNLPEKTGKSLDEWKAIIAEKKLKKHGGVMNLLKQEQGITHGFVNFITLKYREADAGSQNSEDLVSDQYKGKEALLPIYEKLKTEILTFGDNIDVAPKKSSVSMRAKRQSALIKPSTKTRVDLGLKFNDTPHERRLETSDHLAPYALIE